MEKEAKESRGRGTMTYCPGCKSGKEPTLIDGGGVYCSVSNKPGRLGHAVDDFWWYCEDCKDPWRPFGQVVKSNKSKAAPYIEKEHEWNQWLMKEIAGRVTP